MPSALPLPTISELIQAYSDAITGQRDDRSDVRTGSAYNMLGGPGGILFSREAGRDRDLFRAVYTDTASGDDLSTRINRIYGYPRVLDTYGVGTAQVVRPDTSAGAGTIFDGTRIVVGTSATEPAIYAVSRDVAIGPTDTVISVPIRATVFGTGVAIDTSAAAYSLRFDDPLFDATLQPRTVACADGTDFEPAAEYRARVRQARFDSRVGYAARITQALNAVGAVNVALFASNYGGDQNDHGLNIVYIGDAGFSAPVSPGTLLNAAIHALESVRVLGADLQVFPMALQTLSVDVTVNLWQDPGSFNTNDLTTAVVAAIKAYFDGRANAYSYQLDAMRGAIAKISSAVQTVTFNSPTTDAGVTTVVNGIPQWPATLSRYVFDPESSQIRFKGPQ